MPPLRLTVLLRATLAGASQTSQAVLSVLGCVDGRACAANEVAAWVGLRNRFQLARELRRDGLPPFEELGAWVRVLHWIQEAESSGASLRQIAKHDRIEPAVAYRTVRRVTGLPWSQVRRHGLAAATTHLRNRHAPTLLAARRRAAQRDTGPFTVCAPRRLARSTVADRVSVPGHPYDVACSPGAGAGAVLVTRLRGAAVEVLGLDPLISLGEIPAGPAPTRVVWDSSQAVAYVTTQFSQSITIVDVPARRPLGAIAVPGDPRAAILSLDARTLYVTTNTDRVCAVSLPLRRVVATAPVPAIDDHLALHPSGRRLYVSTWRAGKILEVDLRAFRITRCFEVGGIAQDLAISSDGLTLYATNEGGWLDVVHLLSGRRTVIPFGEPAFGLGLSRDETTLFVGLVRAGVVVALDRRSLRVRTVVQTGGRPRRLAVDPGGRGTLVANEAGWVDLLR